MRRDRVDPGMIVPTDGSHIVCPTCGGEGVIRTLKRARMARHPGVHAIETIERCRGGCEGTGWLPPQRTEAEPPSGDE